MIRPIRKASILRNDDATTRRNEPRKRHRRIGLELHHEPEGYFWRSEYNEDCGMGWFKTVADAEQAARQAWGAPCWDLKAAWLK